MNKEEAARQQKVLEQARERFQELAEAEEKYISANIKSRAEALAAVEAMMRELGLTQSQYEAIRDALIAQNVISAAAGQAYAGAWEDLLYGDLAEYGVGYAPVLGNIYFAKKRKEAAASQAGTASGGVAAGAPMPDPNRNDKDEKSDKGEGNGTNIHAGKNFKDHYIRHKGLLEKITGKKYPKYKESKMGQEFFKDLQDLIDNGTFEYQGLGTIKKGFEPMLIYRGNGLTLVIKTNGEFVSLLESGSGMDLGIQFL